MATGVVLGIVISGFGIKIAALIVVVLIPLPLVLKDYRFGVVFLALLLPVSFMLPTVKGLNIINLLTAFTLVAFVLKKGPKWRSVEWLPKPLLWCFLLPATLGIILALPHTSEIARNYRMPIELRSSVEPMKYAIDRFLKPIFQYVGFAFLLMNAIRDSKIPEKFIVLFGFAAIPPTLIVLWTAATYPGSLAQLVGDREFMRAVGMHANEFGMSLALAAGPLLFVGAVTDNRSLKWLCRSLFVLVTFGLVMTFSRGAFLAYTIVVVGYLLSKKQFKTIVVSGLIVSMGLMLTPDVVKDRFGGGLRSGALSDATGGDVQKDELTAGRMRGWLLLAPEVLNSPIYGSGIGSTQWSSAVASHRYVATHPHNIYLEILMDLGLVGLCAISYLFLLYHRRFRLLAKSDRVSPTLNAFFSGSRWSLLGILAMAATHAFYMPNPAQSFMWFSLGFLFAYWKVADEFRRSGYTSRPSSRPSAGLVKMGERAPSVRGRTNARP